MSEHVARRLSSHSLKEEQRIEQHLGIDSCELQRVNNSSLNLDHFNSCTISSNFTSYLLYIKNAQSYSFKQEAPTDIRSDEEVNSSLGFACIQP